MASGGADPVDVALFCLVPSIGLTARPAAEQLGDHPCHHPALDLVPMRKHGGKEGAKFRLSNLFTAQVKRPYLAYR